MENGTKTETIFSPQHKYESMSVLYGEYYGVGENTVPHSVPIKLSRTHFKKFIVSTVVQSCMVYFCSRKFQIKSFKFNKFSYRMMKFSNKKLEQNKKSKIVSSDTDFSFGNFIQY